MIDPSSKTFGLANKLGEGEKKTSENLSAAQEELVLAKGSYVFIHSGRHRGTYGIVSAIFMNYFLYICFY